MKKLLNYLVILFIVLLVVILGCNTNDEINYDNINGEIKCESKHKPKYRVSIDFGLHDYDCAYYIRNDNVYKLFNEDSILTNELIIPNSTPVRIYLKK